jgi:phage-related protein
MSFDAGSITATLELDRNPFNVGLQQARRDASDFAAQRFTAQLAVTTDQAKLDELRAKIAELTNKDIRVNVNTGDDVAKLDAVGAAADRAGGDEGMGKLAKGVLALLPAFAPIGTVVSGLGLGLAGLGAEAGIGLGAFALAVGSLSKGFETSAQGMLTSWQSMMAPIVSPVLTQALGLIKPALADLTPIVKGVAAGLQPMIADFHQLLTAPGTIQAINSIAGEMQGIFANIGPILTNIISTLLHLLVGLTPFINIVLGLLQDLTGYLSQIDFTKVLAPLLAAFLRLAPIVGQFMGQLVAFAAVVLKALSPIGAIVLNVLVAAFTALTPVIKTVGAIFTAIEPTIALVAQALGAGLAAAIKSLVPVILALLPLVKDIFAVLGPYAVGVIKTIATAFVQIAAPVAAFVGVLVKSLGPALKGLTPLMNALTPFTFVFTAIGNTLKNLQPTFTLLGQTIAKLIPPVAQLIADFLTYGATIATALLPVLGNLVATILPPLLQAFQALSPVLTLLAKDVGKVLVDAVKLIAGLLVALTPVLLLVAQFIMQVVEALAPLIIQLLNALMPAINALIPIILQMANMMGKELAAQITTLVPIIMELIQQGLIPILQAILPLLPSIMQLIALVLPLVIQFENLQNIAIAPLLKLLTPLIGLIAQLAAIIVKILVVAVNAIITAITAFIGWITNVSNVTQTLSDFFTKIWSYIRDFLVGVWNTLYITGQSVWNSFYNFFIGIWNSLWSTVQSIWNTIKNFLVGEWNAFIGTARNIWTSIVGAVTSVWNGVVSGLENVWNTVSGWLTRTWGAFVGVARADIQSIVTGVTSVWGGITGGLQNVWDGVKRIFGTAEDSVVDVVNAFIRGIDVIPGVGIKTIPHPYETGGIVGAMAGTRLGPGLKTKGPQVLVGEGNKAYPEYVIPTDPSYRNNAMALLTSLIGDVGMPKLSGGGLIGFAKSAISDVGGIVRKIAGIAVDPIITAAESIFKSGVGILPFPAKQIGDWVANAIFGGVKSFIDGKSSTTGTSVSGATGASASPANANAALGQQMAAARGWTGAEWVALNNVAMRESGWSMTAQNPTSSAYGIAQFINGAGEYAQYGGNSATAAGQITAFLNYIAQRYGDPIGAWAHELSSGWYAKGGVIPSFAAGGVMPGPSGRPGLALLHGGERVLSNGQSAVTIVDQRQVMVGDIASKADVEQALDENITATVTAIRQAIGA